MKIEIRSDGSATIAGYVNVTGRESRVLKDAAGDFVEVIEPGVFARALEKAGTDGVGLMFDHARDVEASSVSLTEDNIGLYARAEVRDAEIIRKAKENQLTGWSFGFYLGSDTWETRADNMRKRTVTDLDLIEVSILDVTPAYIATSIEMRDGEAKLKECRYQTEAIELTDNSQPAVPEVEPEPEQDNSLAIQAQKKRRFDFMCKFV